MVCTRPAVSACMRTISAIRSSSSPACRSWRAASIPRVRVERASMMAIAASSASTTQAKPASASPAEMLTPPMVRKVSVMTAL